MERKTLRIEKVVFGGKGISRDLSKVTFIPFTLPGELVQVEITKEHRDYQEAEVTEVIEPGSDRIPPRCPYFGVCGGCHLSHATYEKQVQMKVQMLQETLQRNRLPVPPVEVIASEPFGYRHKARFQFDTTRKRLGFFQGDTNSVVDIQECLCITPGLNRLLKKLRSSILLQAPRGLRFVECHENEKGESAAYFSSPLPAELEEVLGKEIRILNPDNLDQQTIHFRGFKFPMHPNIFLQGNSGMWKAIVQEVESHHPKNSPATALELYCGAGFFTVSLARRFRKIIACEENSSSIQYARKHHNVPNIDWQIQTAEKFPFPKDATVLIADPPRPGFTKRVTEKILEHSFQRITYISCNVSSFARDVKALSGKYSIKRLTLMDLFPQTFHFETVALLESVQGGGPGSHSHTV